VEGSLTQSRLGGNYTVNLLRRTTSMLELSNVAATLQFNPSIPPRMGSMAGSHGAPNTKNHGPMNDRSFAAPVSLLRSPTLVALPDYAQGGRLSAV
jgi:hypothetical protein